MKLTSLFSMLLAAVLFVSACEDEESANDVVAKMKADPNLSALVAAIETAGLADDLASATNVTIFAPTNTAIGTSLNGVTGDRLANILKYHVATERIIATSLTGARDSITVATLLADNSLYVTASSAGAVFVNGNTAVSNALRVGLTGYKGNAGVTSTIEAGNGIIHVVNAVLWPDAELNILEAAAKRYFISRAAGAVALAGLATSTSPLVGAGPLTLLAPLNPPNTFAANSAAANAFALVDAQGINLADPSQSANLIATLSAHIITSNLSISQMKAMQAIPTSLVIAAGPTYLPLVRVSSATDATLIVRSGGIPANTPGVAAFNVPVLAGDIVCKNGRMHLIGNLILPQAPAAAKAF